MDEKTEIAQSAARLNSLQRAIYEAFPHGHESPTHYEAWQKATHEFHANYPKIFYPGGADRLKGLRACDERALETALNFLEVDPHYFRSGYTKEYIWTYIPRCRLESSQVGRLHLVAIKYTTQPMQRQFWYMCRAMTRIPPNGFWEMVQRQSQSADPDTSKRASYLLAYSKGVESGETLRLRLRQEALRRRFGSA